MGDESANGVRKRSNFRQRYDSAPTLLLPKVQLPDTNTNRHPVLSFVMHALLCVIVLVLTLCLLPLLLPLSLIFRIYRSFLISKIEEREGKNAIIMKTTDALWLQDSTVNRAVINSVMFMKGTMDIEKFADIIQERLIDAKDPDNPNEKWFPKNTKYATQILHRYTWKEEENFQIREHVFQYDKTLPETKEGMEVLMAEIANTPLRRDISPWQFILVPAHPSKPEHYAIVFRGHHALADGISFVQILVKQLIDAEPAVISSKKQFGSKSKLSVILKAVFEGPLIVLETLFLRSDNHTLHGKSLAGHKVISWSDPIDIMLIKKIKNVTGTTVNDVLMSCLSSALRQYIRDYGSSCPPDVLAYVPVSLRKPSEKLVMDNEFVLVILPMPTHTDSATELLAFTTERMNQIKVSPAPVINYMIMRYCMARLPNWLTQMTFDMFARKCSLIVSNVPGPQEQMTLCGDLVEDLMFFAPARANIGLSVSILSYAGHVRMAVWCDKALLSNPKILIDNFMNQVQKLAAEVNVE